MKKGTTLAFLYILISLIGINYNAAVKWISRLSVSFVGTTRSSRVTCFVCSLLVLVFWLIGLL